mgnify:CR=1 FL=1
MKIALKRILTTFKWIGLFFFAITILLVAPIAFLYNLFRLFYKSRIGVGIDDLNNELRTVNYTLDVLGNVTVFNWFDHYKDRHPYGISGQSVSEVLYYRNKQNKLTKFDAFLYRNINKADKGHFEVFEPKEGILKHLK